MSIFQGSAPDVYIHWLIVIFGIGILASGIAVMTSCRSFAGIFHFPDAKDTFKTKFYRVYFRYHSYYRVSFWLFLMLHLMVTIVHIGLPSPVEPFFHAHQIVFFTSIVNFLLIMFVFYSCKSFIGIIDFFSSGSPLSKSIFKRFYSITGDLVGVMSGEGKKETILNQAYTYGTCVA
jgi:hypothetical protein